MQVIRACFLSLLLCTLVPLGAQSNQHDIITLFDQLSPSEQRALLEELMSQETKDTDVKPDPAAQGTENDTALVKGAIITLATMVGALVIVGVGSVIKKRMEK